MVLKRIFGRLFPGLSEKELKERVRTGEAARGIRTPSGGLVGGAAPKTPPKVLPKVEEPEVPAAAKRKFIIDKKSVSQEAFEDERRRRKAEAELGKRPLTFEEAQEVAAGEAGKRERQAEILEREAARRGVSVEELPPEVKEAVTKQALVEGEGEGILQEIADAYTYVDTLGGIIPEEAQDQLTMGTVALGPGQTTLGIKAGKFVLNSAKVATGLRATKAWKGMLNVLKNKVFQKGAGWGALGYVWLTERKVGNIDSALSQVRESITLPVSLAAANPNNVRIAFDQITDLEDDVNEYEGMLQAKLIESSFNIGLTGRLLPVNQRIKKLRSAIELAREQVAKIEVSGVVPTDEETIIMLDEINKILDSMEDPIKFLGVF